MPLAGVPVPICAWVSRCSQYASVAGVPERGWECAWDVVGVCPCSCPWFVCMRACGWVNTCTSNANVHGSMTLLEHWFRVGLMKRASLLGCIWRADQWGVRCLAARAGVILWVGNNLLMKPRTFRPCALYKWVIGACVLLIRRTWISTLFCVQLYRWTRGGRLLCYLQLAHVSVSL